jgi:hypothetical protein
MKSILIFIQINIFILYFFFGTIWNKEMHIMKENTERFSDTRKSAGLEVLGNESK